MSTKLINQIDAILPQTQCTQCGYRGCRPYAEAISTGTPHNQCPTGGDRVIRELAALLQRDILTLNPQNGTHQPKRIAHIRENECIGCTKCIQACPVDAIVGSGKKMHTVLTDECTGCDLCVTPCPVDCIDMLVAPDAQEPELMPDAQRIAQSSHYRERHQQRQQRLERLKLEEAQKHQHNKKPLQTQATDMRRAKQDYIAAAMARTKAKMNQRHEPK